LAFATTYSTRAASSRSKIAGVANPPSNRTRSRPGERRRAASATATAGGRRLATGRRGRQQRRQLRATGIGEREHREESHREVPHWHARLRGRD
jgi:hypothetical protein